jgi:hypothetical protein
MSPKTSLIAVACLALLPAGLRAQSRPAVPAGLEVPSAHKVFLVGHATGTQNYVCLGSPSGAHVWAPFGPQATLFDGRDAQVMTHFLSTNPDEGDLARPTWQHSRDTSAVWAAPIASSSDPAYVEPGAVPWLLLQAVGTAVGPTGGRRLAATTYIQRVHTSGGVAPTTSCVVGEKAFVPYTTDYYFYEAR